MEASKLLNRTNVLENKVDLDQLSSGEASDQDLQCFHTNIGRMLFIEIIHQISLSRFSKLLNRTNELENTVDLDQFSSDRRI